MELTCWILASTLFVFSANKFVFVKHSECIEYLFTLSRHKQI